MNNDDSVHPDAISAVKKPLSDIQNGSFKNNSSKSSHNSPQSLSRSIKDTAGSARDHSRRMSKDISNNHTEDADESEAETVVMPGKEKIDNALPAKKTIRHDGSGEKSAHGSKAASPLLQNGSINSTSRTSTTPRPEGLSIPLNDKKTSDSSRNSPTVASTTLHDSSEKSRSRATSESIKTKHEASEGLPVSRKRKVSSDNVDEGSSKRRLKREETDSSRRITQLKSVSPTRQRASTISNPNSTQKPRRKPPPPSVQTGIARQYTKSVDGDSNESQSPRRSVRSSHAADFEMSRKRRDKSGRTALARACANNDFELVQTRLDDAPEELDEADYAGNTPLHIAALEGFTEIVDYLIKKGCKSDCENVDKDTPLIDAVENSHFDVVKLLLRNGVNPRKLNKSGEEPRDLVDMDDDDGPAIKEELLKYRKEWDMRRRQSTDKGPDTGIDSAFDSRISPPLSARSPSGPAKASSRGQSTRKDLLYIPADLNYLLKYSKDGDEEAVGQILSSGLVADTKSVCAAVRGGHESCLNLLLAMGGPDPDPLPIPELKDGYNTPMLVAIGKGTPGIVQLLLDQPGFDPTRRIYKGMTYHELSEKRAGDHWREEYQYLKTAYDNKNGRSAKSSRISSPKDSKKSTKDRSPASTKDAATSATRNGLTKKNLTSSKLDRAEKSRDKPREKDSDPKSDRKHLKVPRDYSREGSHGDSDREGSPSSLRDRLATSDHEANPRPRKRLVSGKQMQDSRKRCDSLASIGSEVQDAARSRSSQEDASKVEKKRTEVDEKYKKKLPKSLTPLPESSSSKPASGSRRPRIPSDGDVPKTTASSAKVAPMTRNVQSAGSAPVAMMSGTTVVDKQDVKSASDSNGIRRERPSKVDAEVKSSKADIERGKIKSRERSFKSDSAKSDTERQRIRNPKAEEVRNQPRLGQIPESNSTPAVKPTKRSSEYDGNPAPNTGLAPEMSKKALSSSEDLMPQSKKRKLMSRSVSPVPEGISTRTVDPVPESIPIKVEAENNNHEILLKADTSNNSPAGKIEADDTMMQDDHPSHVEELPVEIKSPEPAQHLTDVEMTESKTHEVWVDSLPRVFKEMYCRTKENAYTDEPKSARAVKRWLPVALNIRSEIDPNCDDSQAREQWMPNFQVAGLLVEDLELKKYPTWERIPFTADLLKFTLDKMQCHIHRFQARDCLDPANDNWGREEEKSRNSDTEKWYAMEHFWVRYSDFTSVIQDYPHLSHLTEKDLSPRHFPTHAAYIAEKEELARDSAALREKNRIEQEAIIASRPDGRRFFDDPDSWDWDNKSHEGVIKYDLPWIKKKKEKSLQESGGPSKQAIDGSSSQQEHKELSAESNVSPNQQEHKEQKSSQQPGESSKL